VVQSSMHNCPEILVKMKVEPAGTLSNPLAA
jgi:hypothetical protein